ncbi:MAG: Ribosomal RNA small subunit methyltransferase E [Candidatus Omnitrophica bacterium]|nr:Ribosomal RNA small subunit methyltransferase E [Candidatus Omnitrophota bacterium]
MARFLIPPDGRPESGHIILGPEESRHALRVLRLRVGHSVQLLDARGLSYAGIVVDSDDGRLHVELSGQPAMNGASQTLPVDAAIALVRTDAMEWIVEKLCELGVERILPVVTDRCVVRPSDDHRRDAKLERWRKLALQSCKQCGRPSPPVIDPLRKWRDLLPLLSGYGQVLLPTLARPGEPLASAIRRPLSGGAQRRLYMIGPEGDFTPVEVDEACAAGALPVTLGPLTLRAETAALAVAAAYRAFWDVL